MSVYSAGGMSSHSVGYDQIFLPSTLANFSSVTVADLMLQPSFAAPLLITPEDVDKKVEFSAELVLKIVGILSLIIVIVIGNGMVMLAVRLDRTILALSQSSFLFSMALADALVGIFVLPMALLQIVYEYWPLPPILCILYRCLDVALCTASILHLCAISMDRFWSLRIDYTRHHRARNMRIMIIVVWLLSLIICLPSALPSKFDLQYLGNYLSTNSDDDDSNSNQNETPFHISPFYILDMQQQQQPQQVIAVGSDSLDENQADRPTVVSPLLSSITLPPRPRGNNKVLQSLDDVGNLDCIVPTPFEWLFPRYDDADQPKIDPCKPNRRLLPPQIGGDSSSASFSSPALGDDFIPVDGFADDGTTTMTLYHCTLINDVFYTFASASMSFYIPLIITIVMNVLTFWIAQRTAKAAIKRMHASNPAALMLRAVIPMPIGRRTTVFSGSFMGNSDRNNSVVADDGAGGFTPLSTLPLVEEENHHSNTNNVSNQALAPMPNHIAESTGNIDRQSDDDKETNKDNNNTMTSSTGGTSNHNDLGNSCTLHTPVVEIRTNLSPARAAGASSSFQNLNSDATAKEDVEKRKSKNGYIKRSSSCRNKRGGKDRISFDTGTDATESFLTTNRSVGCSQQQISSTKNLITSVLSNVAIFGGSRQTVVSNATTKAANDYENTIHAVRIEKKRRAKQRERKAAVVLIIVTVTFIVCWLPFFAVFPLTRIVEPGTIPGPVFEATVWLGYVNSAVNPVIYTIFNEEFRRAFANIFLCRWQQFGRY